MKRHYTGLSAVAINGAFVSQTAGRPYGKPLSLFYARFMNYWIIIAATCWKLRKAIRLVKGIFCGRIILLR